MSLVHVSLIGSKVKANNSKHKATSYGRREQREQQSCEEIEAWVAKTNRCDEEEYRAHQERTGYVLPDRIAADLPRLIDAAIEGT